MGMKQVHLTDRDLAYEYAQRRFYEAATWATQHCRSYIRMEVFDVSDFAIHYDTVAEYRFTNEQDATMFRLKWA